MILEPPSSTTLEAKEKVSRMCKVHNAATDRFAKADEAALRPAESELARLPTSAQRLEPPKKKKGPKGPNPLSVRKKKPTVPQPTKPKLEPNPTPIGLKRKYKDEPDDAKVSAKTSQAPGDGHKRKRRRKTNTESSTDHNVP